MEVTTKLSGKQMLRRALDALPNEAKAKIRVALERSAEEIVKAQKQGVRRETGTLANSIHWVWGSREGRKGDDQVGPRVSEGDLKISIYAGGKGPWGDAFYGRWVEFGTRKMSPRPFFFPAYRAYKPRIRRRIATAVGKSIRAHFSGQGSTAE